MPDTTLLSAEDVRTVPRLRRLKVNAGSVVVTVFGAPGGVLMRAGDETSFAEATSVSVLSPEGAAVEMDHLHGGA